MGDAEPKLGVDLSLNRNTVLLGTVRFNMASAPLPGPRRTGTSSFGSGIRRTPPICWAGIRSFMRTVARRLFRYAMASISPSGIGTNEHRPETIAMEPTQWPSERRTPTASPFSPTSGLTFVWEGHQRSPLARHNAVILKAITVVRKRGQS
jgi:hypothetical protein